jgi:hypothetical protein
VGESGGRRVVVTELVTLDGYMVGPEEDMSWVAVGFDPQMAEDLARDLSETYDLSVFGRVTYDISAAYWPYAVAYEEGDALAPAEGGEDPRIISALDDRPLFAAGARRDFELTQLSRYANGVIATTYARKDGADR